MVMVSRSIRIDAPIGRVFRLISDPAARSALNPLATPLRVEIEGGGLLRAGAVCHFRLRIGGRTVEYRTRVLEFEPDRRIVSLADSAVPFQVTLETAAADGGTLLSQTERFEPTDDMLREASPPTAENLVLDLAHRLTLFLDLEAASRLRARREELLAERLGENLDRWLAAIRDHLEANPA